MATPAAMRLLPALAILAGAQAADQHGSCFAWAEAGECETNPGYMLSACGEACAAVAAPGHALAATTRVRRHDVSRAVAASRRALATTGAGVAPSRLASDGPNQTK